MDFGVEPIDGAAIMKQSQGLIFNPLDAQQQGAQIDELRAQAQAEQANVAAAQQKAARFRQFQTAIHTYDGSPQSASKLIMQFPEYADQLKSGQDMQDDAKKQSDLTATGEIYSAALGGNWDLAKKLAHQRADAEKANGYSDPAYDAALGVLDQAADGDETQRKVVLNLLGTHLAAVTGPDNFAGAYKLVGPKGDNEPDYKVYGGRVGHPELGADGKWHWKVDDSAPEKPDYRTIQTTDANGNPVTQIVRVGGDEAGGGGPASGGGAAAGGLQASVAHVLGNEGGYNPKDMNGSPTNFGINFSANKAALAKMGITAANFKDMTKDQAAQIYATKYWPQSGAEKLPANLQAPYFDVYVRSPALAKRALAQSGGDPAKFAQITNTAFQNMAANNPKAAPYAHAWATRDAGNAALATGQAPNAVPAAGGAPAAANVVYSVTGAPKGGALPQYGIPPDMTGPAVLAHLPGNIASQVKALAEGRLPMPSSFALAKPYWQNLLQLTAQYDPTFDAASAPARKAAITAFTGNGKAAQIVGSVNRVANHLNTLMAASHDLAGPDTGFGQLNSLLATGGQAFEPDAAKKYDTAVGFVAGELEKIARNSPGTESGVERVIKNLDRHNSAKTRESAIQTAVQIISGAIDPLKDQYNSAFTNGSTRPNIPWVTPQAQQIYKKIGGVDLSLTGSSADTNAPSTKGSTTAGRQPPAGATRTATGPNGQKAALVNGHWIIY